MADLSILAGLRPKKVQFELITQRASPYFLELVASIADVTFPDP